MQVLEGGEQNGEQAAPSTIQGLLRLPFFEGMRSVTRKLIGSALKRTKTVRMLQDALERSGGNKIDAMREILVGFDADLDPESNPQIMETLSLIDELDKEVSPDATVEARNAAALLQLERISNHVKEFMAAQYAKGDTIKNKNPHIGRNQPCHCGSNKKYKQCCMRQEK